MTFLVRLRTRKLFLIHNMSSICCELLSTPYLMHVLAWYAPPTRSFYYRLFVITFWVTNPDNDNTNRYRTNNTIAIVLVWRRILSLQITNVVVIGNKQYVSQLNKQCVRDVVVMADRTIALNARTQTVYDNWSGGLLTLSTPFTTNGMLNTCVWLVG